MFPIPEQRSIGSRKRSSSNQRVQVMGIVETQRRGRTPRRFCLVVLTNDVVENKIPRRFL